MLCPFKMFSLEFKDVCFPAWFLSWTKWVECCLETVAQSEHKACLEPICSGKEKNAGTGLEYRRRIGNGHQPVEVRCLVFLHCEAFAFRGFLKEVEFKNQGELGHFSILIEYVFYFRLWFRDLVSLWCSLTFNSWPSKPPPQLLGLPIHLPGLTPVIMWNCALGVQTCPPPTYAPGAHVTQTDFELWFSCLFPK